MNRKAVFFDADGTLCDMEKGVPQSTKEALKKLRENGHDAWLCTGRSRAFVSWYLEELPFTGMISACGATIEKDGERLFNKEMPSEVASCADMVWSRLWKVQISCIMIRMNIIQM